MTYGYGGEVFLFTDGTQKGQELEGPRYGICGATQVSARCSSPGCRNKGQKLDGHCSLPTVPRMLIKSGGLATYRYGGEAFLFRPVVITEKLISGDVRNYDIASPREPATLPPGVGRLATQSGTQPRGWLPPQRCAGS